MSVTSPDELQVRLTVGDARTAQAAGVTFARRLFGAHSSDFAWALAEQEHLVERAIVEAGHSSEQAQLATGHFGVGARDEWARLASAGSAGTTGHA